MTFMTDPQPSGGFEWTQEPWGTALRCVPLSAVARHLFTTANLRLGPDDTDEWHAVAERMGVADSRLRLISQVHGVAVATVRSGADGGGPRPEADIVISDDPASAIGVRVADCAPVLLADTRRLAVGAAHAGWRGTVSSAAAAAVRAMHEEFGSDPDDLVAAIGPCLGPCCGEVGSEVVAAFRDAGHSGRDLDRWFATGASGRPHLNLWLANRDQLESAGLRADRIHAAEICTRSHPSRLHSYRAHGRMAGRMVGVIRAGG